MAIEMGQETLQIKTTKRTWRINLETPRGQDAVISIFRETIRTLPDGTLLNQEQNYNAITVLAKDLADLAPYCELSPEVRALLQDPDEETLKQYLAMMPLITSIACDAAERRQEQQVQQQAQQTQSVANSGPASGES